MSEIKLNNGKIIGDFLKPYIIAELNTSHFGKLDIAKEMISAAKEAGCDCVKFQSWSAESLYSDEYYQENKIAKRFVTKFSLSPDELFLLSEYSRNIEIDFSSTPYCMEEAQFLVEECRAPFIKIASMELNNLPYLEELTSLNSTLILSTGMGDTNEIVNAVKLIKETGTPLAVLHCTSIYPATAELLHLQNIVGLRQILPGTPIGFSDHSVGIEAPIAGAALGMCILERHLTLDKSQIGMDNQMASEPDQIASIVESCNFINQANGLQERVVTDLDLEQRANMRRSMIAKVNILSGDTLNDQNTEFKRPGTGISPVSASDYYGKIVTRSIDAGSLINESDLD
ncbi:MAG: N-acylneuraminate-9-phosphate synthase [Flavobacteriaceae bacterium]|nr:N-acylneuraminate-9-phosphate synthase [Flavobacteriaceae bacterium]|tara:strand:+ start:125 stop:1153 length:1029 start_codon:yes stop_codon:yes gene_type:complete